MNTQITLTIPNTVYQQAKTIAESTNRQVDEVLVETLNAAFPPLYQHPNRATMEQEVAAFEVMHPQLWRQYPHQYVAIRQGAVIDYDDDELALVNRIDEVYPETVVLIRQVQPQLQPVLNMRSPRLAPPL